ncbi:hypothetical protein, partial [Roseibium sp.]|uniref:hypothetical protein n=1 Tax=Roseibium sp. TaxID=1936156 RepID=UPI0032970D5B
CKGSCILDGIVVMAPWFMTNRKSWLGMVVAPFFLAADEFHAFGCVDRPRLDWCAFTRCGERN